ncbi:MAG: biotin synthase BioB [bacterium]|nr:biotin synthase BioB [bacterium]
MKDKRLEEIASTVCNKTNIGMEDAIYLTTSPFFELLFWANLIRERFKGKSIDTCSIINAKSGKCQEDCKFCAQSARYKTEVPQYPLVDRKKVVESARSARVSKRFGIVTSGRSLKQNEIERVCEMIEAIKANISPCASIGRLTLDYASQLKSAGLVRYHHNLETGETFFAKICTTHTYKERIESIEIAKQTGLEVCSGGIFGIGECWSERIELAFKLRELEVDSIPLNFLNPVSGTPLGQQERLTPFEALRIIAIFRFIHPKRDIKIGGGREVTLRDLQGWMYYAGANGVMIGNYLTTLGRPPEEDIRLIKDFGLLCL